MSISKLERSNRAHKLLSKTHLDIMRNSDVSTSKNFWSMVKCEYHSRVANEQKSNGKIFTNSQKKVIFKEVFRANLEDNRAKNFSVFGSSKTYYVPPKK